MIFQRINQVDILRKPQGSRFSSIYWLCLTLSVLTGCGSQPTPITATTEIENEVISPSLDFIELANRSSGADAERYRLLALKQSILNQDFALASELYGQINYSLLSAREINSVELSFIPLRAQGMTSEEIEAALEKLVPNRNDLPEWNYYMGEAQVDLSNKSLATEYYFSCSILPESQISYRTMCRDNLWSLLLDSDQNRSDGLAAANSDYLAWIELAKLFNDNSGLIESQTKNLELWFSNNPDHPARLNPPKRLADLILLEIGTPSSVALVLPLSGRLQAAGEAVMDGFLSAAYQTGASGYQVPQVEIFDTETLPIELIAEILSDQDFDIAVGPLDADKVALFENAVSPELTLLSLNQLSGQQYRPSHFGFSLAVEGEAHQAAQLAIESDYKTALVLVEDSNIGERAAGAFADEWLKEDREIYDLVRLSDSTTLTQRLEQSFHLDQSESRKSQLQTLLGKALAFTPRRRQDIDTIFLASNSVLARQVTPTLAFLFAQDVPALATSRVYDQSTDSEDYRDLEALIFLAPPWLAGDEPSLAESGSSRPLELQKLEAMGVDAFFLSRRFRQLEDPEFRYQGKTGEIFVGSDGNLIRTMEWVRLDAEKMVPAR